MLQTAASDNKLKAPMVMHRLLVLKLLVIFVSFFTLHIRPGYTMNPDGFLTLGMEISHRFPLKVQGMFLSYGIGTDSGSNKGDEARRIPPLNHEEHSRTKDLHGFLHMQDRRRLAGSNGTQQVLAFSSGNETMDYGEFFGWLHYAVIDVGSPNASFLVALDTGSDQLWIPCQCQQCASTTDVSQSLKVSIQPYNPSTSNTSKYISCGSSLCHSSSSCLKESDNCAYSIDYLSDNTSSSGILVEDVIHLASATTRSGDSVEFPFVFGCAKNQTGDFLNGGAPNGLLGLGFGESSLPSSLAKAGLIRNSFSMCFQDDGSGRIFFGDQGSSSQQTTPLLSLINVTNLPYVVALDKIIVGDKMISQLSDKIIIDTGTSFTYLPVEVYAAVTGGFDAQVQLARADYTDSPWEYCYKLSSDADVNTLVLPGISVVFEGGGNFSILSPVVGIANEDGSALDGICLAISESKIPILGQNFMLGYQLVFDRQDMKLGWSPSDCYKLEVNATSAPSPNASPAPSSSPSPSPSPPSSNQSSSIPPMAASSHMHVHAPLLGSMLLVLSLVLIDPMATI